MTKLLQKQRYTVVCGRRSLGGLESLPRVFPAALDYFVLIGGQEFMEHAATIHGPILAICALPYVAKEPYCAKEYPDLFRFARYMARSAVATSVSASVPCFGKIAIPILALRRKLVATSRMLTLSGA